MLFQDRRDAGRQLGARVGHLRAEKPVVLAIPYGGVPIGFAVAQALGTHLDLWMTAKVPVPEQPALAYGSVSEDRTVVSNRNILWSTGLSSSRFQRLCQERYSELERRIQQQRDGHPPPLLAGRSVVLVDDGMATGATARAAARAVRAQNPRRLTFAVPVASADALALLRPSVDDIVCLHTQPDLWAVAVWYRTFEPITDLDVRHLVALSREEEEHDALALPSEWDGYSVG